MNFNRFLINELIALRKELHQYPELAEKEFLITKKPASFVSINQPDELIKNLGGTGFMAVFTGKTLC